MKEITVRSPYSETHPNSNLSILILGWDTFFLNLSSSTVSAVILLLKKDYSLAQGHSCAAEQQENLKVPWQAGDIKKEISSSAVTGVGNNQPVLRGAKWLHSLFNASFDWKIWSAFVLIFKSEVQFRTVNIQRNFPQLLLDIINSTSVFTATPFPVDLDI